MYKRSALSLVLSLVFLFSLTGCGSAQNNPSDTPSLPPSDTSSLPEEDTPLPTYFNPLTGETSLSDSSATNKKPVCVVINNLRAAQKVQSGISKADLVFETEVEGGITRLLAFFADVSEAEKIGSVRSLRVVFADIAAGFDALLFYHGIDEDYCAPHLKSLKISSHHLGYSSTDDCFRENNGLSYEHRLYTSGELIDKVIQKKKMKDEGSGQPWLNFSQSDEKTAPSGTSAVNITAAFSSSYSTQFIYDSKTGKYARARKDQEYTDYFTGERELFTNVFILKTSVSNYDDGYHRKVSLKGGEGYYASAGGIIPIKWEKGDSKDNFKFTLEDGTDLTVNAGNSYICIMNKKSKISYE